MQFIDEQTFKVIVTTLTGVVIPTALPASSVQLTLSQAQQVVAHINQEHGTNLSLRSKRAKIGVTALYRALQLNHGVRHGLTKTSAIAA